MSPAQRQEQILVAAVGELVAGRPLSASGVARAAGVAPSLVYHYFGDREGLRRAVADRERALLLADTEIDSSLSVDAALDRAIGAYVDHFEAARGGMRAVYVPGGDLREGGEENHRVHVMRVRELMDLAQDPLTDAAIGAWLAMVVEVATSRPESVSREQVVRLCRELLYDVVARTQELTTSPGTLPSASPLRRVT